MNSSPTLVSLATLALASIGTAQQTWVVDVANGPGSDFGEITDAIAGSFPGDTLFVRNGTYQPFVVTRGVRIIGADSVVTRGGFHVRDVPAGETVVIRDVDATVGHPAIAIGFLLVNNAGGVHLHGVSNVPGFLTLGEVDACTNVSFVDCDLTGAATGLAISNSAVQFDNCRINHAQSAAGGGGQALACIASTVHLGGATEVPRRCAARTSCSCLRRSR